MIRNRISSLALATVCLQVACSGSSSNAGQGSCTDISGSWNVTQIEDDSKCGGGTITSQQIMTDTQNGCSVTMSSGGEAVNGTVTGNQISGALSISDTSGTTTGTLTGSISADGKTITTISSWTWQSGTTICSGTTESTATRLTGGPDAG
jgi:hypothetical protein